jgi:cell division protein FtsB
MDDIKPSQSLDGMSKPTQPQQNNMGYDSQRSSAPNPDPVRQPEHDFNNQQFQVHTTAPKSGKGIKALLLVFILLFVAASTFAFLEFSKASSLQKDLDASKAALAASQQEVDSLTYDNKDLTNKYNALLVKSTALKKTCGASCSTVALPDPIK